MRSCKQVSFLVSESLDQKLSLRERLSMQVHLQMCKACKQMARQIELLRATSRRYGSAEEDKSRPKQKSLSKEANDRILGRLRQAKNDHSDHE